MFTNRDSCIRVGMGDIRSISQTIVHFLNVYAGHHNVAVFSLVYANAIIFLCFSFIILYNYLHLIKHSIIKKRTYKIWKNKKK